jgi:hypothetical protein
MSVVYPMIILSQFQMASVAASLPPFLVGCHSLHLDEGIAVGVAQNELGRSLDLNRFKANETRGSLRGVSYALSSSPSSLIPCHFT